MRYAQIPADIWDKIAQLLADRPYREVGAIMDALRSHMRVVEDPVSANNNEMTGGEPE